MRWRGVFHSCYGLVATLLHEPVLHRDMLMYLPAVRRLSDAATTFVDFALQFVKDHDPNTLDTATVAELAPPLCTRKGP